MGEVHRFLAKERAVRVRVREEGGDPQPQAVAEMAARELKLPTMADGEVLRVYINGKPGKGQYLKR